MVLLDAVKLSKGTLHDEANMLARLRAVKCELEFPDLCSPSSSCSIFGLNVAVPLSCGGG